MSARGGVIISSAAQTGRADSFAIRLLQPPSIGIWHRPELQLQLVRDSCTSALPSPHPCPRNIGALPSDTAAARGHCRVARRPANLSKAWAAAPPPPSSTSYPPPVSPTSLCTVTHSLVLIFDAAPSRPATAYVRIDIPQIHPGPIAVHSTSLARPWSMCIRTHLNYASVHRRSVLKLRNSPSAWTRRPHRARDYYCALSMPLTICRGAASGVVATQSISIGYVPTTLILPRSH